MSRFCREEDGAMAFFVLFMFLLMIAFGGIAVDVMRFETRRVAMQQTMDRAALAAASLKQGVDPTQVVNEYFDMANLDQDLDMVEFNAPSVVVTGDSTFRKVDVTSQIKSYNYFMQLPLMNIDYLESPALSSAQQGVSQIEVILVLDVSGSMANSAGNGKTKIKALRDAAANFVTTIKDKDTLEQVSIGFVPYNAQVKLPLNVRQQFTVSNLATYNGVANAGFPEGNCIEIPQNTYASTGLSLTNPFAMAAVADTETTTSNTGNYLAASSNGVPSTNPLDRICNASTINQVFLPTKNKAAILSELSNLTEGGYTSIAIGMRWGVALIDQSARPIYTAAADATVAGRPVNNTGTDTRKIIVLMTDGEHVATDHVPDAYKTGPSPIYRGTDGLYAIRFMPGGSALTGGNRPSCAGTNQYFVPHLKTGTSCLAASWRSTPSWTGSGTVRQLDWSEVWRYLKISYVARQIYMRSGVTGATNYNTIMDLFVDPYIAANTMDSMLATNCNAAKDAGVEIYGIAFAAPSAGQTVISGCSSSPKENYYFNSSNGTALDAAFTQIATNISELRLTQ